PTTPSTSLFPYTTLFRSWIDLHTGLGPSGHGERIFACRDEAPALARARAWWGDEVTSIYDGTSSSAKLTGLMWLAAYEECPQAEDRKSTRLNSSRLGRSY